MRKEKIGKANKGRKPSIRAIEASVKSRTGVPLSEERKQALRVANNDRFGDKNPNWKGGTSYAYRTRCK